MMVVKEIVVENKVVYFMLDKVKSKVNGQIDSNDGSDPQEYTKGWLRFPIEYVEVLYTNQ